jgi:hypothetical protein
MISQSVLIGSSPSCDKARCRPHCKIGSAVHELNNSLHKTKTGVTWARGRLSSLSYRTTRDFQGARGARWRLSQMRSQRLQISSRTSLSLSSESRERNGKKRGTRRSSGDFQAQAPLPPKLQRQRDAAWSERFSRSRRVECETVAKPITKPHMEDHNNNPRSSPSITASRSALVQSPGGRFASIILEHRV